MPEEKNTRYQALTWTNATAILETEGIVDLKTGSGGPTWNEDVRQGLAKRTGLDVMLIGTPPGYTEGSGFVRYTIAANNNRQASRLLSKTEDE